jgi:hypothetical protein
MKRDGVLRADFDLGRPAKVDPYQLDQKYWQQLWPKPANCGRAGGRAPTGAATTGA